MAYGTKLIVLLSVASALLSPLIAAASAPQLTPHSRFDDEYIAYTRDGTVKLKLREVQTEANGKVESKHLSVFVLFDPTSRAFTWRLQVYEEAGRSTIAQFKNGNGAAILKDGQIVVFWAVMFRIYIRDCHGHASSIDDAEAKALEAASQFIASGGLLGNGEDFRAVLLKGIDYGFLYPPMSMAPSVSIPQISDLRWDEDKQHWILTLKARWIEEVTLDGDYNLVSMKKVE